MIGQDFAKHDYSSGYPLSVMPVTVVVLTGFPTCGRRERGCAGSVPCHLA
jgi:hypothetical protein